MLHPTAKFHRNQKKHRRTFDVISIFQDGGHRVRNLLLSSRLVTAFVQNGENLCAYQIWMRYLNPLLKYNYLRFGKTDGRHVEILYLVSVLTHV